jgi:hypothetical protein
VWFVDNPVSGQPQIYIGHRTCPDTAEGCNGEPPRLSCSGSWPRVDREQLIYLVEHPLSEQTSPEHGKQS